MKLGRLLRTVAVVGLVMVGLARCTGVEDVALVTPEGWQRVESGALSFAVPGDWVEIVESSDPWSVARATDAEIGTDSFVLTGAPAFGQDGAGRAVDLFVAGAQIGGWGYRSTGGSTPVGTDVLVVERNDFEYDDVQGVFWAASDPGSGVTVALKLTGRDLPANLIAGIEESIAVVDR